MGAGDPRTDRDKIVGIVQADDMDPIPVQGIDSTVLINNDDPIDVAENYNFDTINKDQTTTITAGGSEEIIFDPPSGFAYLIKYVYIEVTGDADATSGLNKVWAYVSDDRFGVFWASNDSTNLWWKNHNSEASSISEPTDDMTKYEILKDMVSTPTNPFKIVYSNETDAAMENTRNYRVYAQEVPLT